MRGRQHDRSSFRYELRSAEQLAALASARLPLGISSSEPRRSVHRDLYIDSADDVLRRRGITLRLRIGAEDRHLLSLRVDGSADALPVRVDARVRAADVQAALAEDNPATRRLRAFVDPTVLAVQLDLEVERLTRTAHHDFFRRPRFELHFDRLTVRRNGSERTFHHLCGHLRRGDQAELDRLAHALEAVHDLRQAAGDPREHAELLVRWKRSDPRREQREESDQMLPIATSHAGSPAEMLNPELSLLAFQRRVLAIAADAATPLKERLRFLGIVSSNVDELYMVRMSGLRRAADDRDERTTRGDDGLTSRERLSRVEAEVAGILDEQSRVARECLRAAEQIGARIVTWETLTAVEQDVLRARCRDEIHPGLTPLAMTLSPGHPLPHLPHLGLSLAVVFRGGASEKPHLAEFELPSDVPRLLPVPGRAGDVIAIEELLRANVDLMHPNVHVEGAHLFRVTRRGDLTLDEEGAESLLHAVAEATERRPYNPAVRVEVERSMPAFVAELVLESLRRDAITQDMEAAVDEVQVIDGLIDLRCLADLPLPPTAALEYPPLRMRSPVPAEQPMFGSIRERDLLVHHPFDSFEDTVVRFLREAAADPAVTTIRITLYRVGDPSPVVAALLHAASAGKRVVAFVELKARFDEEHNVSWARALEKAGVNVVYGLVGLKTHAKVALVVRREGEKLQRYVHVGTGNYNARAGRQYTDLSLFSARDELATDIADLFNALTGSAQAPQGLSHGALVAPNQLLTEVLARIARETAHARAGKAAAIAIKVNGLSDPEVVRALYDASEAGVQIDLVVRGICTLAPGVPGRSSRIRVTSVVGRFLEHSRIYRFANDGAPEYFIGSSDLRPRNLRRRVELLVPVPDAELRARLDRILELYQADPTGWDLGVDGIYVQRSGAGPSAQAVAASG
ncbi:MAG: polyphosphate kinase 1 [Gemmatimonadaceae bacterium]